MIQALRHVSAPTGLAYLARRAAVAGLVLAGLASGSRAQSVLNSSSQDRYRQQANEGHRRHDFSPRTPPRSGRFIYGHWTPYNPPDPSTIPSGTRVHVIQRGDTLWDLSGKYYKDNYLWPFIWEANPWVTYPHWIYPGDTLVIPPLMMLPSAEIAAEPLVIPDILEGYFPAGSYRAVNCGHFIADANIPETVEIIAGEADPEPILFSKGDIVYINAGSKDGALPGDEFAIVYPRTRLAVLPAEADWRDDILRHPRTSTKLGVAKQMAGRLKIILLGEEVSAAEVTYSCDQIEVGFELLPFDETPIPLVRRDAVDHPERVLELPRNGRGYVVYLQDIAYTGALGSLLSIDLGTADGLIPGDVLRIYRDDKSNGLHLDIQHWGSAWDMRNAKKEASIRRDVGRLTTYGRQEDIPVLPPRLMGSVVVLYAEDHTATCAAVESTHEFTVGDAVVYDPMDSALNRVAVVNSPLQPGIAISRQSTDALAASARK